MLERYNALGHGTTVALQRNKESVHMGKPTLLHTRYSLSHKGIYVALFFLCLTLSSCGVRRRATLPQFVAHNRVCRFHPHLTEQQKDSLLQVYGENKVFIEEFLEPTLIALSYYPELKTTRITFRYSKEKTTMAARPVPLSLLAKARYLVLVNNVENFKGIHLSDVPFNAQIGVIGHELAHIVDYQNKNLGGVLSILFRYADKARKPLFEKEIDRATVERGLGWQLYDWAVYAMYTNPYATPEYKEFKKKHYMQPEEIEALIMFLAKYAHAHEKTFSQTE